MGVNIEFEHFIGKNIDEFDIISGELKHNADLNKYSIFYKKGYEFYGEKYYNATVKTDKNNIITEITIYIHGIIDKPFYDAFNDYYELPNDILVVDYAKEVSKTEEKTKEKVESELSSTAKKEIFFKIRYKNKRD